MAPPAAQAHEVKRPHPFVFAIFTALLAFGFDATHGQLGRHNYNEDVIGPFMVDDGTPKYLPGTNHLIKRHYTGIAAIDELCVVFNILFTHIPDGSSPPLSLWSFQFGAQFVPIFTIVLLQEWRVSAGGLRRILVSTVLWGLACQLGAIAVVIHVYLMLSLALPRPAKLKDMVHIEDPSVVASIAPAFVLGYFLPTVGFVYRFQDGNMIQVADIVWQIWPLHLGVWLAIISFFKKRTSIGAGMGQTQAQTTKAVLDQAYGFALTVALVGQVTTGLTLLAAQIQPQLFPPGVAETLTWDEIIGSASLLFYTSILAGQAGLSVLEPAKIGGILVDYIVYGPAGAALKVLRQRDEYVLSMTK